VDEKDCLTPECRSYNLCHTAKVRVNKSITGNLRPGAIINLQYQSVVHHPDDPFWPDFQGHNPQPKLYENWKVFFDKRGEDTFYVAPPNGWWLQQNEKCW